MGSCQGSYGRIPSVTGVLTRVTWSHPQCYRGQTVFLNTTHLPRSTLLLHRDKDVPIFSWKLGRITSFTPSNHVFRTMFSCLAPDHVFSPCFSKNTKNNRFDHVFWPMFCSSTWCKEPKGVAGAGLYLPYSLKTLMWFTWESKLICTALISCTVLINDSPLFPFFTYRFQPRKHDTIGYTFLR